MPPKTKITAAMIIEAAFEIIREQGLGNMTARTIAEKLGCSTQPVLYHFKSIEEIKRAVYERADAFHSEYISVIGEDDENPMITIGLQYIRFAVNEKNLFHFLFQSNGLTEKNMMEAPEMESVLNVFQQCIGANAEQTRNIFWLLFLVAHGYACMFANNTVAYDEKVIAKYLVQAFDGAVYAVMYSESQQ